MKRFLIALIGSALVAAAPTVRAHDWDDDYDRPGYSRNYERGYWMGRDMPMHRGMMDGCPYDEGYGSHMRSQEMWGSAGLPGPALGRLGLTAEQAKRAAEIQGELNQRLTTLEGQLVTEQGRFRELYAQPSPDRSKAADVQQRMGDLRRQRAEAMRSAYAQIEALLSPDQRAQWRNYRRW